MEDRQKIREFIQAEIMEDGKSSRLGDTDSLVESGVLDSMGIQVLLHYLEKTFRVSIPYSEVLPEHFENVESIARFISAKTSARS